METAAPGTFDPQTPPDTLTAMNLKLDQVLATSLECKRIAQACLDATLIVQAAHVVPARTRMAITFAGSTAGGFLAQLLLHVVTHR